MNTSPQKSLVGALIAVVTLALAACSPAAEATLPSFDGKHVTAAEFALAVEKPGVVLIDVRTPEEVAEVAIPGAVNINLNGADFASQIAQLDPSVEYAVYCRSGNRSRAAIEAMTSAGITSTVGLEGGIGAWTAAGYAVVSG